MTDTAYRKDIRLATAAYQAALASKWKTAEACLKRLSEECGGEGMMTALIGWCDVYVDHATDGQPIAQRVNMAFMSTDSGRLDRPGSANVPASAQWAARLIQTRAAMDAEAWDATIKALPKDPLEMSRHVFAVLEGVATTVNGLPRGYARMGREDRHG